MSLNFLKYVVLFLFLFVNSESKLAITFPQELANQYKEGLEYGILLSMENTVRDRKFVGSLVLANPVDACSPLPPLDPFKNDEMLANFALVARWGECHYAQKVRTAELAGFKMLVLIMNQDKDLDKSLEFKTTIQVVAIKKSDGDKLVKYLESGEKIRISFLPDPEKQVNQIRFSEVKVEYWFSSAASSQSSYNFLNDLKSILAPFGSEIKFYPRYVLWKDSVAERNGFPRREPMCIGNGRYCDPEPYSENSLSGRYAVMEDLRQLCFRELPSEPRLKDAWWQYTLAFGAKCLNLPLNEIDNCRKEIYRESKFDEKKVLRRVDNCIRGAFNAKVIVGDPADVDEDNLYLDNELDLKEKRQIDHYPSLYVNGKRYTGSFLSESGIQKFICVHALDRPKACKTLFDSKKSDYSVIHVLIGLGCVMIVLVILYCVRRSVKREFMSKMNDEVQKIVTQYKKLENIEDSEVEKIRKSDV